MAEQFNSLKDNNLSSNYIDNAGKETIREQISSFLSFNKGCLDSESCLHNKILAEADEKNIEEMGIVKLISPLIVDSSLSDRIDVSFTKEMNFVSTNLKELLEKIKIVHTIENSLDDKRLVMTTKSEDIGNKSSSLNDRFTELKNVLPEDLSSESYQAERDILPDVIEYIKMLQNECNQRQEIKQQIKCLLIQLMKSALTLKRIKDVTKGTMTEECNLIASE